jgi:hypothetical protein
MNAPARVFSPRILRLAQKLKNAAYRKAYLGSHIRQFLARQIREMRGEMSQKDFGDKIGKPQNVVSRLEDASYGKWTLSTLLEIANKLDRALIVRFVDYSTFLNFTDDQSDAAANPEPYDYIKTTSFAWDVAHDQLVKNSSSILFFEMPKSQFGQGINVLDQDAMKRGQRKIALPVKGYMPTPESQPVADFLSVGASHSVDDLLNSAAAMRQRAN